MVFDPYSRRLPSFGKSGSLRNLTQAGSKMAMKELQGMMILSQMLEIPPKMLPPQVVMICFLNSWLAWGWMRWPRNSRKSCFDCWVISRNVRIRMFLKAGLFPSLLMIQSDSTINCTNDSFNQWSNLGNLGNLRSTDSKAKSAKGLPRLLPACLFCTCIPENVPYQDVLQDIYIALPALLGQKPSKKHLGFGTDNKVVLKSLQWFQDSK